MKVVGKFLSAKLTYSSLDFDWFLTFNNYSDINNLKSLNVDVGWLKKSF